MALLDARANTIGTSQGNLISGNGGSGLLISGAGATNNHIAYNKIGVDAGGSQALGNSLDGITLWNAPYNTIGGETAGQGNRIAANGGAGVHIYGEDADGNLLFDNQIGLGADGAALGNTLDGVLITNADGNVVGVQRFGAFSTGLGNTIANNQRAGVAVVGTATGNSLVRNALFDNQSLGIDLGANGGVDANDILDADTGPNLMQNHPYLFGLANPFNALSVEGTLYSAPNTTYTLDFYASTACDPSIYGEGQQWLGSGPASTDGNGVVDFNLTLGIPLPAGKSFLTATATDPSGNTSEFSYCYQYLREIFLPLVRR